MQQKNHPWVATMVVMVLVKVVGEPAPVVVAVAVCAVRAVVVDVPIPTIKQTMGVVIDGSHEMPNLITM